MVYLQSSYPPIDNYLSYCDYLEDKREDYQNFSALYNVPKLYPIIYICICILVSAVLTGELGPVGLLSVYCLERLVTEMTYYVERDSLFTMCVYRFASRSEVDPESDGAAPADRASCSVCYFDVRYHWP